MKEITIGAPIHSQPIELSDEDPIWAPKYPCNYISFCNYSHGKGTLASLIVGKDPAALPIHLAEPSTSPPLMDSKKPAVKLVIRGTIFTVVL